MSNQKYEAFLKAAETGSFKRAAEELGYTQAGISYMIAALEKEMGTALFTREHSGVTLTVDGRELLPWMQAVCNSERALQTRLDEMRSLEAGTVRICAFASVAIHWLPGIVEDFARKHPHIDLGISCIEDQGKVEASLENGDFDCAFIVLPTHEYFFSLPLALDPIYVVTSPNHPLASAPFFPTEALASEPYIEMRTDAHDEFDALFERHGVRPATRLSIDNDYAVMGMVAKKLGFSLFPRLMLRNAPFELARIEPEIPTHRELAIAVRSYEQASFATRAFIECTQSWVAKNGNDEAAGA